MNRDVLNAQLEKIIMRFTAQAIEQSDPAAAEVVIKAAELQARLWGI